VCEKFAERRGESPPCSTCRKELDDENYEVAKVFFAVRNHWITNGEKIIDVDIRAVESAMRIYQIPSVHWASYYERIRNVFLVILDESRDAGRSFSVPPEGRTATFLHE
jgi:hypothetical protein